MARELVIRLTEPQEAFVFSDAPFPAFVGGFGAGKSEALVTRLLLQKLAQPQLDVGYFAPTFDLVRLIGFTRFEEKLAQWQLPYKLNKTDRQLPTSSCAMPTPWVNRRFTLSIRWRSGPRSTPTLAAIRVCG